MPGTMPIALHHKWQLTTIRVFIVVVLSACLFNPGYAQMDEEGLSVKDLFKNGNYGVALKGYLEMLKKDPDNIEHKHKIGVCYLYINGDKSQAIPYLEEVIKQNKYDPEVLFDLGKAYQYDLRFDDAIKYFNKYKVRARYKNQNPNRERSDTEGVDKADRQIEMCHNGKELIKYPIDVTFENLGKNINSPFPDYSPFIPEDESFLVFTSRRRGNRGNLIDYDGFNTSDIYLCKVTKGVFSKAQNITLINTESDEEAAGISPDGQNILVFVDDVFQNIYGNIYLSAKRGKSFQKITSIGENINSNSSVETAASITSDGVLLYFASDRKGGYGGTDLYVSKKLPDGEWGIPVSLGPEINSKYNEDYPIISYDGKTMYFSSEGHTSMGGYDIFKSEYNEETGNWQSPTNIGYPINTPDDNMNISFSAAWDNDTETARNKYAYISAYREGGFGDMDIYRVTFNSVESRLTAIRGSIVAKIPADNSEHITYYYYKKNDKTIALPEECHPWYDKSWTFKESKKVKVRPGYQYKTSLYFDKGGVSKVFSSKKYPKNDPSYVFVNLKTTPVKKKDYIPLEQTFEMKPLPNALITLTNKENGEEFSYMPAKTGNYVIIIPPGKYNIMVDVTGYKLVSEDIVVLGKNAFKAEIIKDFVFTPAQ